MASPETVAYYQKWLHEKYRAQQLGKTNYEANCDIEISRLETENPELLDDKQELWDEVVSAYSG